MTVIDETFAPRAEEGAAGSVAETQRAASPTIPTVHQDAIAAIMGAKPRRSLLRAGTAQGRCEHLGGARRAAVRPGPRT